MCGGGDALRDQNGPAEGTAQRFDPRRLIDRRTDHGEVQPVGRADIAIDDVAVMERDSEANLDQAFLAPRGISLFDPFYCITCGGQCGIDRRLEAVIGVTGKIASTESPMNFSTSPP